MQQAYRVGLIVPSSNTTMETEIPEMLRSRSQIEPEQFTFHSSRMRMKHVTKEELTKMDHESVRCAVELSDARCDVLAYACLVAIMCQGPGYHVSSEIKLTNATEQAGDMIATISSAGALIEGLKIMGAKKISIVTPYMKPLTQTVIEYIESYDIQVLDSISLEVADNLEVGRLDPMNLIDIAQRLNIQDADAVVLSACVQMPSLPAVQEVENRLGIPVLTAATSTVYQILKMLNLKTVVPNAGKLLSGSY
ncbi:MULTISPECIES: aspartate/glutamate racemase family protein [unclassified Paenibacillus]|uniref:maleate cis-trans isomerase family protein n=1 Tax=unclassified Paenibacillus TaxID=185978 RepID=UPI001AE4B26F|nr:MULTISPECIES: aspartate/glutamate racemase family protein [unclassified Paenibacillus]MBP1157502.1 maleate isomerase [Paenibacillus sp. PvP091]MBP1171761.1 maleate isomerase [Paenibacillus sp. PvR098]MBP2438142.1 maleate isomerase [Paenibacillus sp. PvP052]